MGINDTTKAYVVIVIVKWYFIFLLFLSPLSVNQLLTKVKIVEKAEMFVFLFVMRQ